MATPRASTTLSSESVSAGTLRVETCANPNCSAKFKKLGDGVLFAKNVDDPLAWGLASGKKQKVVWLCAECAKSFYLGFETSTRQVVLHLRRSATKGMAA
jgi:hypothetical protein